MPRFREMAGNIEMFYRPICRNAGENGRRDPLGWAQPQKSNLKPPGSRSQRGVCQARQCQHPSHPTAGARISHPWLLTPQDGALLGRLQNQTFRLAGLASRRKLFLLYSRKRHWKTLTTYQCRCKARGRSPRLLEAFISASPRSAPPWRLCCSHHFGTDFPEAAAVGWMHNRRRAKPDPSPWRRHCRVLPTPGTGLVLKTQGWFITGDAHSGK